MSGPKRARLGTDEASRLNVAFDLGDGPVIVFCHGVGAKASYWAEVVSQMTEFRCIGIQFTGKPIALGDVIDRRAALLSEYLLDLNTDVALVGHSLGGSIAAVTAAVVSGSITHIVLEAPGGLGPEINPFALLASTSGGAALAGILYRPLISRIIEGQSHHLNDGTRRLYRELSTAQARQQLSAELRFARRYQREFGDNHLLKVASAVCPTLLLWGEDDLVLPVVQARRAIRSSPGVQLQVIPGAGHTPHVSHPDIVASYLREFLSSSHR